MPDYAIVVSQLVPTRELLKYDDRITNPRGGYTVVAPSEEKALDVFHSTVPIGCVDDFDVTVTRVSPPKRHRSR